MKLVFQWLLAGSFALLCAIAPARAQNTVLGSGIASLAQSTEAVIALSNDGALSRSTNLGVDFTAIRAADEPIRALYTLAASGSTVIAMGDASYFVRSTNSGLSYTGLAQASTSYPIESGVSGINAVAAYGTGPTAMWVGVGFVAGRISILRSLDDGANWTPASSIPDTFGALNGVAWTGQRWVAVGSGIILTSTDGNTWTTLTTTVYGLNAVASDGAGKVVIVGDAGTIFYATDGGATNTSFVTIAESDEIVSDALRVVAHLSGDNWIIGGDSSVLVSFNGTLAALASDPVAGNGDPITALLWTGSGANYYVSSPTEITPPAEHGPISLQIALVSGQLQLTLVGAEDGNSYHIESSATLASFTAVPASTQAYSGGPAPTWNFPTPAAGGRVFYRAVIGAEP